MKTIILLSTICFAACSSNYVKQQEQTIPVPTARDTVYITRFVRIFPDSIGWQDIYRVESEKTKVQLQILLSAEQTRNDSLLRKIRGCQDLFSALKSRTTVQIQPNSVKFTPPPVLCPPEETHGLFYFVGFAVIVAGLTVLVTKLIPVVGRFV